MASSILERNTFTITDLAGIGSGGYGFDGAFCGLIGHHDLEFDFR